MAVTARERKLLLDGEWIETGEWQEVRSPYSGEVVGRIARAPAQLLADLAPDRLDPGLHADLGDPSSHRAETDHADPTRRSRTHVPTAIVTSTTRAVASQPS